jgi:hypothetical protein
LLTRDEAQRRRPILPNLFFESIYLGVVSSVHFRGAGLLAHIDAEVLAKLRQNNSLINGWQKPERTADSKDFIS